MPTPFLSVVIPTRERADTLYYALRSCVTQEYPDAEFIVCNNASTDNTEAVVSSFNDPRIRLINPGKRLSMRENWEFALNHVSGQYVMFIGDDDAVMPHGLRDLAELLATEKVDAVKWQAPTYFWSRSGFPQSGRVMLALGNRVASVRSSAALNALRWGYLYYHFLPMIYHGALSLRLINEIKARSGQFFCCENPDIYSGIVAALMTKRYLYLQRPLTISGASRHSNGTVAMASATVTPGTPTWTFYSENNLGVHRDFLKLEDVPSSIHLFVTDALLRARDLIAHGKLYVPLWFRLFLIVREVSGKSSNGLQSSTHPLRIYSAKRNMEWLYNGYLRLIGRPVNSPDPAGGYKLVLSIDAERFGAEEVYSASNLLDSLLGCIQTAPADTEVTTRSLLFGRLLAKLARFDTFRLFKLETFL